MLTSTPRSLGVSGPPGIPSALASRGRAGPGEEPGGLVGPEPNAVTPSRSASGGERSGRWRTLADDCQLASDPADEAALHFGSDERIQPGRGRLGLEADRSAPVAVEAAHPDEAGWRRLLAPLARLAGQVVGHLGPVGRLLCFVRPEHHRDVGAPGVVGAAPLEAGQGRPRLVGLRPDYLRPGLAEPQAELPAVVTADGRDPLASLIRAVLALQPVAEQRPFPQSGEVLGRVLAAGRPT